MAVLVPEAVVAVLVPEAVVAPKDAAGKWVAGEVAVPATMVAEDRSHTAAGADPLVDNSNGVVLTVSVWSTGRPRPSPASCRPYQWSSSGALRARVHCPVDRPAVAAYPSWSVRRSGSTAPEPSPGNRTCSPRGAGKLKGRSGSPFIRIFSGIPKIHTYSTK